MHFALNSPHLPALFLVFNRHMKRILLFASLTSLLLGGSLTVSAQKNKGKVRSSAAAFVVNKATTRKTVSISGHSHEETETSFSITWKSAVPAQEIFYRPDAAHWLKCKATRSEKRSFGGSPNDYMMVDVNIPFTSVKPGDNINLTPEKYPSEVQPNEVKSMPAGALCYQPVNSKKWQVLKVNVTKLPDFKRP